MGFPGVVFAQRGVDAALRGHRVAADWMDFGDERNIKLRGRRQRRPHAGQPGADDEEIVDFHATEKRVRIMTAFIMAYAGRARQEQRNTLAQTRRGVQN
jgi:hypothetical protein